MFRLCRDNTGVNVVIHPKKANDFTTMFIQVNTIYNINKWFRLDKASVLYKELMDKCKWDNYRHMRNASLYIDTTLETEPKNLLTRKCVLFAQEYNVPLVYFPEFANPEENSISVAMMVDTMKSYLQDTEELLKTIQSLDINEPLKRALCDDISHI
jgi:hypothetical protein